VKRTSLPTLKPGTVEENAGTVDHPRERASIVGVDAALMGLGVELEHGRQKKHRQRPGIHRLFLVEEPGSV
jgi:hypothetical protein